MTGEPNFENRPDIPDNPELIQAIEIFYNYLRIEDQPQASDAIVILGGSSLAPITKAVNLYNQGLAPKVAFISTGGQFGGEKIWGMPENEKYQQELLQRGIPSVAIVSSGLTTNTLDEARKMIPFLVQNGIDPKQLILVSRPIHQRRASNTFRAQYPDISYLNCPADEPLDINDLDTQKRLVAEAERLLDYSKKGDIISEQIPLNILKAAATIRRYLKSTGQYQFRVKPKNMNPS